MAGKRQTPGFGISLGITSLWLSLIVLLPLAGLFLKTATLSWTEIWETVTAERVVASYRITILCSFLAALTNAFFGPIVAWVLVRYPLPGKRLIDALVDMPFALPTAVAGITLTTLYADNGLLGSRLAPLGLHVSYTAVGIWVALVFIGLPFTIRTVQPVLQEIAPEVEEAAANLGATRLQTIWRIIIPAIWPALLTGFSLAFARALGEYGSVVFIAGNMPMKTEITALLIITKLEQYEYAQATAIAATMLLASFAMLLVVNIMQWWFRRRMSH